VYDPNHNPSKTKKARHTTKNHTSTTPARPAEPPEPPLLNPELASEVVLRRQRQYSAQMEAALISVSFDVGRGHFKLCPVEDGKAWYLNFYFRSSQWPKHYVCVFVPADQLAYGVILLCQRVSEVTEGLRVPSPDKYL